MTLKHHPNDNVLLYLLSKSGANKNARPNSYFHYASKKSLDKIGGGNLVKRNLVGNAHDLAELENVLFNNELPCVFEYYVNGNNEVVMVCKHQSSQQQD
ncbi:hypothetical protein M8J77_010885 [Diaphorina citri]|nr:hypothetical protein M8J77_010885 [Diaphorina citri]